MRQAPRLAAFLALAASHYDRPDQGRRSRVGKGGLVVTRSCRLGLVALASGLLVASLTVGASAAGTPHSRLLSGSIRTLTVQRLRANKLDGDAFGFSVAVSGTTAIVGAPFADRNHGAAYIYHRTGNVWRQQAKLTVSDRAGGAFGKAVAIFGTTAVVTDEFDHGFLGAAYVFVRSGGTWVHQHKLMARNETGTDDFGWSVAVRPYMVVVGAPSAGNTGAAYVFAQNAGVWREQAKLTASDGAAGDNFGWSVAISRLSVLVGAPGKNSNTGSAYDFLRPRGVWRQRAILTAANAAANDRFGWSVAVDRSWGAVGAPGKSKGIGAAYIFSRPGWAQGQQLTPQTRGEFGYTTAIADSTLIVGAPANHSMGVADLFTERRREFTLRRVLRAPHRHLHDRFGGSVGVSGEIAQPEAAIVVGAPFKHRERGAAYAFFH